MGWTKCVLDFLSSSKSLKALLCYYARGHLPVCTRQPTLGTLHAALGSATLSLRFVCC